MNETRLISTSLPHALVWLGASVRSRGSAEDIAAFKCIKAFIEGEKQWTDEQCREFCRVAFRHRHQPGLPTQTTLNDIRYGAYFAAQLGVKS